MARNAARCGLLCSAGWQLAMPCCFMDLFAWLAALRCGLPTWMTAAPRCSRWPSTGRIRAAICSTCPAPRRRRRSSAPRNPPSRPQLLRRWQARRPAGPWRARRRRRQRVCGAMQGAACRSSAFRRFLSFLRQANCCALLPPWPSRCLLGTCRLEQPPLLVPTSQSATFVNRRWQSACPTRLANSITAAAPPPPPKKKNTPPPPPPPGLRCGGGSVGNGACAAPSLCCSQWGHCGAAPLYCALEAGCLGGPCRSYAGTPFDPVGGKGRRTLVTRVRYRPYLLVQGLQGTLAQCAHVCLCQPCRGLRSGPVARPITTPCGVPDKAPACTVKQLIKTSAPCPHLPAASACERDVHDRQQGSVCKHEVGG